MTRDRYIYLMVVAILAAPIFVFFENFCAAWTCVAIAAWFGWLGR